MENRPGDQVFDNLDNLLPDKIIEHTQRNMNENFEAPPKKDPPPITESTTESCECKAFDLKKAVPFILIGIALALYFIITKRKNKSL